jgi:hypothetical protein
MTTTKPSPTTTTTTSTTNPTENNPLFYDLQELTNAIRLLSETNDYLSNELLQDSYNLQERKEFQELIIENEEAIIIKHDRANEIRVILGIPTIHLQQQNRQTRIVQPQHLQSTVVEIVESLSDDGAIVL